MASIMRNWLGRARHDPRDGDPYLEALVRQLLLLGGGEDARRQFDGEARVETGPPRRSGVARAEGSLKRLTGIGLAAYRAFWAVASLAAIGAAVAGQLDAFSPTKLLETMTLLAAAAILFRRRGGDAIAAMLSLAFLLWVITASSAWAGMGAAAIPLAMLDRLRFLIFVAAMMLFPAGRFDPRWTLFGVVATFGAFCLGIAAAARLIPAGLYVVPAMACAALAVAAMRARLASLPPGVQRQQIKWVALGLAAGLCLVGLSRLGLLAAPALPHARAVSDALFDLGIMSMALGVLLALLRFRLYDADAVISRSTSIAAVTLALIGTFAGAEAVIQSVSQNIFGDMAGTISSGVAAAIAAALVAPVHNKVAGWAERRFQRALTSLREDLPDLLDGLRETADLAALGDVLLIRLERGLRISRAALLVGGVTVATRHVEACEIAEESLFPLRVPLESEGAGAIGWLLLGPRPDQSALGKDEQEAIDEIVGPIARAIRAVQRHMARDAEIEDLTRRLRALESVR